MRGNVERDDFINFRGTRSLSFWVSQCLRIAYFRSTFLTLAPDNVARQGLEERMLKVLLGLEDFLVARGLPAHLPGNDFSEWLEGAPLIEVPARILCKEDLDQVVEASML